MIAPERTNQRTFTLGEDMMKFHSPSKTAFRFEPGTHGDRLESPRSRLNRSSDMRGSRKRIDFPKSSSIEAINHEALKKKSIVDDSPHFAESLYQKHLVSQSTHRNLLSDKKPDGADMDAVSIEDRQVESEESQEEVDCG